MREKKEINIQIGEQVRAAREQACITQEQLAERIEVSPQYVSDLERGVVGVSLSTLKKICVSLCVSSDQILFSAPHSAGALLVAERCRDLNDSQLAHLSKIIDIFIDAVKNP